MYFGLVLLPRLGYLTERCALFKALSLFGIYKNLTNCKVYCVHPVAWSVRYLRKRVRNDWNSFDV